MSASDDLIANNAAFAASFSGGLPTAPTLRLAVVACMDSRLDVLGTLGLGIGQAHVIRNAGGIVTDDVLRSLAISQRKLGTVEILLVHHTKCGLQTITDEEFAEELRADTGSVPAWRAGAFTDVDADVRESIARIQECPFVPHRDAVRGLVFDVDSGEVREVLPGH